MNDQTHQLIRELAEKFGTTTEHLWGVLVRQAPITGIQNILTIIALISLLIVAFRFVREKTKELKETAENGYSSREWDSDLAVIVWILLGFFALMVMVSTLVMMESLFAAFLNPEYWALMKILR